ELEVGGGQAGLAIGARLKQVNIDTLLVDREAGSGDNSRKTHDGLTLDNQEQDNHLPYMTIPTNKQTSHTKDLHLIHI
ncbi:hypothetical protein BST66_00010, partial [Bradyrhizobium canariense]